MGPAGEQIASVNGNVGPVQNAIVTRIQVPLNRNLVRGRNRRVDPEAALLHLVRVLGVGTVLQCERIAIEIIPVHAIVGLASEAASVPERGESPLRGAAASDSKATLGVLGALRNDVDYEIDGVAAPQGCPRAADYLDAIDVFDHTTLHIPEHAST